LRSKRSAILAFTLFLSLGIAADAQSTALTLSFTGSGIGTSLGFFLNGNGTLAPLGTARLSINGVPTGSTTSLAFAFLFPDGSTMAAAAAANPAPGTLTGTATISGGTGAFAVLVCAQLSLIGLYLPPVFKMQLLPQPRPPQTIISLPVHTAVCWYRPAGAPVVLTAAQLSLAG